MAGLGSACLLVGLLTALYAAGVSVYGARTGNRGAVASGRRAGSYEPAWVDGRLPG